MIALTAGYRKGTFEITTETATGGPVPREHRVTGTLAESYCCPTSAHRPPRWLARRKHCVDPVLSVPDSSAPSPPGPSGSGLFAGEQSRHWANESWSFFVLGTSTLLSSFRGACSASYLWCAIAHHRIHNHDNEYGFRAC